MADPLSITASVLTVLQVAESLVNFIREVKNASEEQKKVLKEVLSVKSVLRQLYNTFKDAGKHGFPGDAIWENLKEPLEICQSSLESLMDKLNPMHGFDKACKSVMWKFQRNEIRNILADLERQKSTLILALHLELRYVPPCVLSCTPHQLAHTETELYATLPAIKSLLRPFN